METSLTKQKPSAHRFTNVDAMRGLAATLVVWFHFSDMWVRSQTKVSFDFFYQIAWGLGFGRIGVLLFFCISGFVIPSSLYGSKFEGLRRFIVRRFLRLYPAYWISIPLGLIAVYCLNGRPIYPALVLANLTMVPEWFHIETILGPYWTLHIEIFFYLLCGGIFLLSLIRNEILLIVVGFILHFVFLFGLCGHYFAKYFHLHIFNDFPLVIMTYTSNLGIMFWGTLLRLSFDGKTLSKIAYIWIWFVPTLWIIILPLFGLFGRFALHNMNVEVIKFPLTAGVAIIIFLCGLKLPATTNRFVLYLGAISYSLYLFHIIVYALVWKFVSICFGNISFQSYIVLPVSYFLAVCFAAIIYHLVELPSQRLAKRLT